MRSRTLVVLAALAGAVLVLLPLGGGALAATSNGANGDIAFVKRRRHHLLSEHGIGIPRRRHRSVLVARRNEARVLARRIDRDVRRQRLPVAAQLGTGRRHGAGLVARRDARSPTSPAPASTIVTYPERLGLDAPIAGTDSDLEPRRRRDRKIASTRTAITRSSRAPGTNCADRDHGSFARVHSPAWSPDGTTIAFQSERRGINVRSGSAGVGGTANQVAADRHRAELVPALATSSLFADACRDRARRRASAHPGAPPLLHQNRRSPTRRLTGRRSHPYRQPAPPINGGSARRPGQLLSTDNGTWNGADPTRFPYTYHVVALRLGGQQLRTTTGGTSSTYAVAVGRCRADGFASS